MKTRVLDIVPDTAVDGRGMRTSIYFAGCLHKCKGCHNPESWSFDGGTEMEISDIVSLVDEYDNHRVTFSGGDPMYRPDEILCLIDALRERIPDIDIWVYTGFLYDDLVAMDNSTVNGILSKINVLVDGPFIESLKSDSCPFRGSSNQRIIELR